MREMSAEHLALLSRPCVRKAGHAIAPHLRVSFPVSVYGLHGQVSRTSRETIGYALLWLRDIVGAPLKYDKRTRLWRLAESWSMPWERLTPAEQIKTLTELVDPGHGTDLRECIQEIMEDHERLHREVKQLRKTQSTACQNPPQPPHSYPNQNPSKTTPPAVH